MQRIYSSVSHMRPLEPRNKMAKAPTTQTAFEISLLSSVFGTPVNYYISINSITFKQIQFKKAEVISLAMRIIIRQDANSAAAEHTTNRIARKKMQTTRSMREKGRPGRNATHRRERHERDKKYAHHTILQKHNHK